MNKNASHFFSGILLCAVAAGLAGCNNLPFLTRDQPAAQQQDQQPVQQTPEQQAAAQPGAPAALPEAGGTAQFTPPAPAAQPAPVRAPAAQPAPAAQARRQTGETIPAAAPARTETPSLPAPVAPAPPPPPPPKVARLSAGTRLVIRTTTTMSTKTHNTGDTFVATLDAPISHDGWVVAPSGSTVMGRIAGSDPGGRVKGKAELKLELTSLSTVDGQNIHIQTPALVQEAKSSTTKDAVKVGVASGIGAAIGAIAGGGRGAAIGAGAGAGAGTGTVMATRGDPAVVPAESVLTFELLSPVTVVEKR